MDGKDKEVKEVKSSELADHIKKAWDNVVELPSKKSNAESTILDPLKKKIVKALTNRVLYLGNTTTNMVKSPNGKLKKYLSTSIGGLTKYLETIHNMLLLHIIEIQATFGRICTVLQHRYCGKIYTLSWNIRFV